MKLAKQVRGIVLLIVMVGVFSAAAQEATSSSEMADPIVIDRPAFMPEGIEYDGTRGLFLVGSLTEGTIYTVQVDGATEALIEDGDLINSVGIEVDVERGRLLVANANFGAFLGGLPETQSLLGIYDLETGERLHMVDLQAATGDGRHFVNDIALDGEGNAYVTDSAGPIIFKVDVEGQASVLVEDDQFAGEVDFGNGAFSYALNGIAYHADGYLIVASSANNGLFKVTLDDPVEVTSVTLEQPIVFPDGLLFAADGNLVVVSGLSGMVLALSSDDDWASAAVVGTFMTQTDPQMGQAATTATMRDGEVYVLYTSFNPTSPPGVYQIGHVEFADPE